ncbi:MAG: GNAT family N-acetyltransferase [Candidatus Latescibacteria bacterium]|nr:GNAT family N-acetyltransferase [bacterium]MBD3425197.1 GNAT family N-acetyltransferase [Candidatus Latescibacterota bacterium]
MAFQVSKEYERKKRSVDSIVKVINPGSRIFIGSGAAEPQTLINMLIEKETSIKDHETINLIELGVSLYAESVMKKPFKQNAFFIGQNVRNAVNEGRAEYTPIFLSELPALISSGQMKIDVAFIQIAPPDNYGFCSLGVSTDVVKAGAESADIVVAEVNKRMPRVLGDCFIHLKDIDYLVESDLPLPTWVPPEPDEVAVRIGKNVARLIEDGATIQAGIGMIPNAILNFLDDKNDLGVHTEMFSDGIIDLVEKGVITNRQKTLHNGKIIATFCMGSQRLYDFVDDNPLIEFHPCDYTNDPFVIAQNNKMVSVNAAIQIDLTGQVCADSIGEYFYSGIGGQVDFVRGAARSRGGKPIIVLPSTAREGEISRIVPCLDEGAGVVTSRGDVHYIATEYGIVNLHGKNLRERALALTSISHPDFRDDLINYARKRNIVHMDQMPLTLKGYPEKYEHVKEFGDKEVFFRPVKPTDEKMQREFFYSLSDESVYYRFFNIVKTMPHEKIQPLVNIDYREEMCIVGLVGKPEMEDMIAIGRFKLDPADNYAEIAFLVRDDWQGLGIGTHLMNILTDIARERKISGFKADVLAENRKMLSVFHNCGYPVKTKLEEGSYSVVIDISGSGV